jgi:hypothetical protein
VVFYDGLTVPSARCPVSAQSDKYHKRARLYRVARTLHRGSEAITDVIRRFSICIDPPSPAVVHFGPRARELKRQWLPVCIENRVERRHAPTATNGHREAVRLATHIGLVQPDTVRLDVRVEQELF